MKTVLLVYYMFHDVTISKNKKKNRLITQGGGTYAPYAKLTIYL